MFAVANLTSTHIYVMSEINLHYFIVRQGEVQCTTLEVCQLVVKYKRAKEW